MFKEINLRDLYWDKVQELMEKREYDIPFYDLSIDAQYELYEEAEVLVHEELQEKADNIREEMKVQK